MMTGEALGQQIKEKLEEKFGANSCKLEQHYDFPVFIVNKKDIIPILEFLKNEESCGFSYLTTMCGTHFPDANAELEFSLMYQLHNMERNHRIRLKIFMPKSDLVVPTLTEVYPAANWMEREAYDFYGFHFAGHPNLKRILNMDEMNYHPMRKEYPLEDGTRHDKEDKYFGR